jgi:hypothetical protein
MEAKFCLMLNTHHSVMSPPAGKLAPLADAAEGGVYLMAATLRPETMYGQTNCWALPDGKYGAYKGLNGEVYVMTYRSALNLSYQVRPVTVRCPAGLVCWGLIGYEVVSYCNCSCGVCLRILDRACCGFTAGEGLCLVLKAFLVVLLVVVRCSCGLSVCARVRWLCPEACCMQHHS